AGLPEEVPRLLTNLACLLTRGRCGLVDEVLGCGELPGHAGRNGLTRARRAHEGSAQRTARGRAGQRGRARRTGGGQSRRRGDRYTWRPVNVEDHLTSRLRHGDMMKVRVRYLQTRAGRDETLIYLTQQYFTIGEQPEVIGIVTMVHDHAIERRGVTSSDIQSG